MENLTTARLIVKSSIDLIKSKENKKETQRHTFKEKEADIESYSSISKPFILVVSIYQSICSFYSGSLLSLAKTKIFSPSSNLIGQEFRTNHLTYSQVKIILRLNHNFTHLETSLS